MAVANGVAVAEPPGRFPICALERAERQRSEALGTTKEVLVITDFVVFKDFLGFPSIVLGFLGVPRISDQILIWILI